ncbi:MAG: patatin-like phospholipase family protein [Elusimicrobia bacterium]|nr:patatin-like phospholipase family protein [Elusimicrobiota bacterium]
MTRNSRSGAVAVLSVRRADPATPAAGDLLRDALWLKHRGRPAGQRPRVALVLSGGGARGLAHIGALKVLAREKVPVDLIVGTSVGSLVGALYASSLPAGQIENLSAESGWSQLTDLSAAGVVRLLVTERLLSTRKMEAYLTAHIGDKKFADLKTEFACVAADLRTGEQIVLREGSVALAARASATMPGIFEPVPYRHRLLIDGGVVNNVPTDVARRLGADIVICVYPAADFSRHNVTNVLSTLMQALYIQGQVISEERLAAKFLERAARGAGPR